MTTFTITVNDNEAVELLNTLRHDGWDVDRIVTEHRNA